MSSERAEDERTTERIARRFHEEYEALAPAHEWATQEASAVPWDDLPDNQRRLMVNVVANLIVKKVIRG